MEIDITGCVRIGKCIYMCVSMYVSFKRILQVDTRNYDINFKKIQIVIHELELNLINKRYIKFFFQNKISLT